MKTIIHENERGLLFRDGRLEKLLLPGSYHTFGGRFVELLPIAGKLSSELCPLDTLLQNRDIAKCTVSVAVADGHRVLHYVDGNFSELLLPGKYAFWTVSQEHTFTDIDIASPEITDLPPAVLAALPEEAVMRITVLDWQCARLYYDRRLVRVLEGGIYFFWRGSCDIAAEYVDLRLTQLLITGQELLTSDKVALRISFVCHYRITDPVKIDREIDDFREQLHTAAQLAMRDYVGHRTLDEILEKKEELSAFVSERLSAKASELYIAVSDAGVRDIILPGDVREIMNTVLLAEKNAPGNVITRREEVASTRSLLNTARLMDENKTLYRLKEMETIERICEQVGNIQLNGSGDLLEQLSALLGKKE